MIKREGGFSLVSALVAMTLGLITVLAISTQVVQLMKAYRHMQALNRAEETTNSILQILSNPESCRQSLFAGAGSRPLPTSSTPLEVTAIRNVMGSVIYDNATPFPNLKLARLELSPAQRRDDLADLDGRLFAAQLKLRFEYPKGDTQDFTERLIPVLLTHNGAGQITACANPDSEQTYSTLQIVVNRLGSCPAGFYIKGFRSDGELQCDPMPPVE